MPANNKQQVKLLTPDDIYAVERLLRTSEYIYQRFTLTELAYFLKRYPAVGIWHDNSLYGFLLSQIVSSPFAWISGFGVSWTESKSYIAILSNLLEHLAQALLKQGVQSLHYSGNDEDNDWLRGILLKRGFLPFRRLYAYDKYDFSIPTEGNQQVTIRPVDIPHDLPVLLELEVACFEDLWRNDSNTFIDVASTHPYFVVVELNGNIVGYQFNSLDDEFGYLVRIAVHPSVNGQGIGARLMAEAVHFFQKSHVDRIMLNTQEENHHAHRLYEWFGFERLPQKSFVLRKTL